MCSVAVAAIGIAMAAETVNVVSQNQRAHAAGKAINAANVLKQAQIDQATSAQINDRLREGRRERGRIEVAAGEAGLNLQSGNIETLLMDSYQQAELADDRSLANREAERQSAQATAVSQASEVSSPTLLGAGLQIGLAGGSAYLKTKSAGS